MDPEKKISFGFSKLSKKPSNIVKTPVKQVELVDCLEGQSIKLKNETKFIEKKLVIPLRDNKKYVFDRVREIKLKQKAKTEHIEVEDTKPDSELTEDELAARELIKEAKLKLAEQNSADNKVFILPIKTDTNILLEGEKESTLDDYENVPVSDFGLAMLRGMGWKEGVGIGKNSAKATLLKPPELRPKGLGLGASALANSEIQNKSAADKNCEVLILKKGSYGKIVAGHQKGNYCEVQGLDDEAGRVIVKTTLKGEILALNEFMLVAVTKEDYSRNSKVLNNTKFNKYKEMEQKNIRTEVKSESSEKCSSSKGDKYQTENGRIKKEKNYSNSEQSEMYHKNMIKSENLYSSYNRQNSRKDKSLKYTKHSDDSNSDCEKSRKTHKRKDKRRHRDKSRSPNRMKHKSSRKGSKSKHRYSSSSSDSEYLHKSGSPHKSDDNRHRRRSKY